MKEINFSTRAKVQRGHEEEKEQKRIIVDSRKNYQIMIGNFREN